MTDVSVNIRSIQHFLYCPRRFALLEINDDWEENAFVVKANIMHEHVHDGSHSYSDSRKVVRSDIAIFNDLPEYDIFGKADCIEFLRDKNGVEIQGLEGNFSVAIIEYKPKAPKAEAFSETDAIQVFAQKICADFIWNCNSKAYIYYSDTRKRVALPFDSEYEKYDEMLKKLLSEMRAVLRDSSIPARKKGQKCSGCSLQDICFPKTKSYSVREIVMSETEVGDEKAT
ncbi:MAG: CRISPR-associated protein Cas4 [Ruminiclostridium sp.]